jgi:hypothetical protein
MSISAKEKMLIHVYASAAQIPDPHYRQVLRQKTGKGSCADPAFSHADADRVLAALEATLFDRVRRGDVPDPRPRSRWIREEYHFRRRVDDPARINSRQAWAIRGLWEKLCPYLPESERTPQYMAGIVARATGRSDIGLHALSAADAGMVIDALRDRLAYAIRNPGDHHAESARICADSAVPF